MKGIAKQAAVTGCTDSVKIDFPHYTSFRVQIARPVSGKMGSLFLRENDDRLVGHYLKTP